MSNIVEHIVEGSIADATLEAEAILKNAVDNSPKVRNLMDTLENMWAIDHMTEVCKKNCRENDDCDDDDDDDDNDEDED